MTRKKTGRMTPKVIAYHEAGHAIMDILCEREVVRVTIIPGEGYLGIYKGIPFGPDFQPDVDDDLATREKLEAEILGRFAGLIAVNRLTGRSYTWSAMGSHHDIQWAYDRASNVADSGGEEIEAYLRWLWIRAENRLTATPHWPLVEAVAAALLERHTLSGDEVRAIVHEVAMRDIKPVAVERLP